MIERDSDPFNLKRFVEAQGATIESALSEFRHGRKRTHWMWFVFPQIEGLGHSPMAREYAIKSFEEAEAYLRHPILGSRLQECTEAVLAHAGRTAHEIFGSPDDMKFRSSMTLFDHVRGGELFGKALAEFCGHDKDRNTLDILHASLEPDARIDCRVTQKGRLPSRRAPQS
jgi:uncharacterized protein (DUF1810 family)